MGKKKVSAKKAVRSGSCSKCRGSCHKRGHKCSRGDGIACACERSGRMCVPSYRRRRPTAASVKARKLRKWI